jgi:hypothetical protein
MQYTKFLLQEGYVHKGTNDVGSARIEKLT